MHKLVFVCVFIKRDLKIGEENNKYF